MIKRSFFQFFLGLLFVLVMVFGYLPFRNRINAVLFKIKDDLIHSLESKYDLEISYKRISPTIINSIRINGLSLQGARELELDFTVDRINVYYRFKRVSSRWTGEMSKISLKNGHISLHLPQNEKKPIHRDDISHLLRELFPESKMELKNMSLTIYSGDSVINIYIIHSLIGTDKERISYTFSGEISYDDIYSSRVAIDGVSMLDLSSLSAELEISEISTPYFTMEKIELNLNKRDDLWELTKIKDKLPVDFSIQYQNSDISIQWESEDFIPNSLFSYQKDYDEYSSWFDTSISGSFTFITDLTFQDIMFNTKLELIFVSDWVDEMLWGTSLITVQAEGSNDHIDIDHFDLTSPRGEMSFAGYLDLPLKSIDGEVKLIDFTVTEGLSYSAEWLLSTENDQYTWEGSNNLNNRYVGDIICSANYFWHEKKVLANLALNGPLADTITLDCYIDYAQGFQFTGWFDIESASMDYLIQLFPQFSHDLLVKGNDLHLSADGSFNYDSDDFNLFIENCRLGGDLFDLSFYGFSNDAYTVLSDINVRFDENNINGTINVSWEDITGLALRFSLNGNYYDIFLKYDRKKRTITWKGTHGLEGEINQMGTGIYGIAMATDNLPFIWKEYKGSLGISAQGVWDNGDLTVQLREGTLTFDKIPGFIPGEISWKGLYENNMLSLYDLSWSDRVSTFSGTGMFYFPLSAQRKYNGWITLKSQRDEALKLSINGKGKKIDGSAYWENIILNRMATIPFDGFFSGNVFFHDLLLSPQLEGDFSIENENTRLSSHLNLSEDNLIVTNLEGSHGKQSIQQGILAFNIKEGKGDASFSLSGELGKKRWISGMTLGISDLYYKEWTSFKSKIVIDSILYNDTQLSPPLTFILESNGEDAYLYNSDRDVLNGYYNMNTGYLNIKSQKLLPLSFQTIGTITGDNLDFTVSSIEVDLPKINPILPDDKISDGKVISFVKGVLKGEMNVTGSLDNPVLNGELRANPFQLDTVYSVKEKGMTQIVITVVDNQVNIPYFQFAIGQSGMFGVQGDLTYAGYGFEEFDFNFYLDGQGERGIPLVYVIKGLALNGEIQGKVNYSGIGKQHKITGDVIVDETVLSLAGNSRKRERNRSINPLDIIVDLTFTTGRNVSMVIPNEDFHFVMATLDIDQTIELHLENIPDTFTLTGEYSIKRGEIAYFDKTFFLTQGNVLFDEDRNEFNPQLSLTAETVALYQSNEVSIIIDYEGSLFSDFEPSFSSMPSYPEREILAMLEPYQSSDSSSIAVALGSYVDDYTFSAPFEEGLKRALNVDLVTIETGFLKNILEEQLNISQGVSPNESSQYNVARYLDGTFLNIGKYIGKDLFMSGGLKLDYDENQIFMGGMGVDLNLTLEMETPLFNVGWTYLPDDQNSYNSRESLISDMGITINFRL